jgi:cobalt/nickel transport system ATP-binding protein
VAPLIRVEGLRYRYEDGAEALRGVNFELAEGETVALLGPNGSGKTTFVLHLNGLLTGEGKVEICGLAVNRTNLAAIRRKVGMVFQDSDTQLFMPTVLEDIAFGPINRGMAPSEARQCALDALAMVGMKGMSERAPYHLSAGEKKKVAIAGVLAMAPEILVLDEPSTFLDPPGQRALISLLRELPQAKIVVTHNIPLARALASRAVFFQNGMIEREGCVDDLVAHFGWSADLEPIQPRSR